MLILQISKGVNEVKDIYETAISGGIYFEHPIIKAAETAHRKNIKVIALTGNSGGKLASISDIVIRVPHQGYADRIQEIHIKIIHIIINLIEQYI